MKEVMRMRKKAKAEITNNKTIAVIWDGSNAVPHGYPVQA